MLAVSHKLQLKYSLSSSACSRQLTDKHAADAHSVYTIVCSYLQEVAVISTQHYSFVQCTLKIQAAVQYSIIPA